MQSHMKRCAAEIGRQFRLLLVEENGSSAIEYALLASCIAVVIAAAVNAVGSNLRDNFYNKIADAMPG